MWQNNSFNRIRVQHFKDENSEPKKINIINIHVVDKLELIFVKQAMQLIWIIFLYHIAHLFFFLHAFSTALLDLFILGFVDILG